MTREAAGSLRRSSRNNAAKPSGKKNPSARETYRSSSGRSARRGRCGRTPAEYRLRRKGPTCRQKAFRLQCCTPGTNPQRARLNERRPKTNLDPFRVQILPHSFSGSHVPSCPHHRLQAGSPYHEIGDGVGIGRREFPHAVVGHGSDAQHSLFLEHPAGQGNGQLVITRLRVPTEEGRPRKDGSHARKKKNTPPAKKQTVNRCESNKKLAGVKGGNCFPKRFVPQGHRKASPPI